MYILSDFNVKALMPQQKSLVKQIFYEYKIIYNNGYIYTQCNKIYYFLIYIRETIY